MPERDSKQPEGKPAEHKPEDAREEAEGRPDAADQPEEEGGLDVRVFLVGLLIVAFIVAAYINRQYYAKPKKPPPPPAAVPGTGAGPSGPAQGTAQPAKPPTPAEHYAGIVAQSKFQISHEIFVCHGQTFLLARPAVPISQKTRDGGFLILKAMLFDITKRLDGIAEQAFTRRWVPPGEPVYRGSPMFVSLGLNDKLRPLLVEAEEAGLEPKPPEGEAEPKEEQPRRIVVRDSEAVIGVTHEGRAKAYPVRILNFHDVVNDTIAETPIAVTWTAVADAATVIVRSLETEGKSVELHFGSAGLMHNSGVVVYDLENGLPLVIAPGHRPDRQTGGPAPPDHAVRQDELGLLAEVAPADRSPGRDRGQAAPRSQIRGQSSASPPGLSPRRVRRLSGRRIRL